MGLKAQNPGLWARMPKPFKGVCPQWVRSWSMDDARRGTAEHLAKHVKRLGLTHVGFHDTDTGSYANPCQWNERSQEDRARWGDDFAAATAHKLRIYYDALKRESPSVQIIFTQYPYNVEILDPRYDQRRSIRQRHGENTDEVVRTLRERSVRFWRGLHDKLPADVALAIREAPAGPVRRFRELAPGRAVLTWNAVQGSVTMNRLFGGGPRWAGSFCHHPHDVILCRAADIAVPLNSLAVREYSWNVHTPGAGQFRAYAEPENEVFTVVLPRIVRNVFGRDAAADIVQALSPRRGADQPKWNMSVIPWHIFTRDDTVSRIDARLRSWVDTSARMRWQAQLAEDSARALDRVWTTHVRTNSKVGMTDYAFRRFVNLREIYHGCRWMAAIRVQELLASERWKTDPASARAAAETGRAMIGQARAALAQLVKERPSDPVLARNDHASWSGRTWRAFMADKVTLNGAEGRLQTMLERRVD